MRQLLSLKKKSFNFYRISYFFVRAWICSMRSSRSESSQAVDEDDMANVLLMLLFYYLPLLQVTVRFQESRSYKG